MKISYKIALTVFLSTLVFGLITVVVASAFINKLSQETWQQVVEQETALVDINLKYFLEQDFQVLDSLVRNPALQNAKAKLVDFTGTTADTALDPTTYSPEAQAIDVLLRSLKESFDHFEQLELGTIDGGYLMYPPATKPKGYDPQGRSWYKAAWDSSEKWARTNVRKTSDGSW
jgi:hypothetical protein